MLKNQSDPGGQQHVVSEGLTIDALITEQAHHYPDKIAIKHNEKTITYSELELSSDQIASFFKAEDFVAGDVIAVAMDRSIQMAVCLLAIMKAGAAYLPIDPNLPVDRVNFLLKDSSAKAFCTSKKYLTKYQDCPGILVFDDIWLNRSAYPLNNLEADIHHNLAYILYTSGSTGLPKGVAIAHYSLLNLLSSMQKAPGISPDDNMLGITTMSFDISELELFLPLVTGARLTIADAEIVKDGRALVDFIKAENITIVQATPFSWRMMLEFEWDNISPIKALCGGEALARDLADKLIARCDELWNVYGPTETTVWSAIKKMSELDEIITVGNPIDNTQIYILDNDLNEVAPGVEGEICIGGEGVAIGYVNRPELTQEKFIADKFSKIEGQRIYRTGDLGRITADGEIQCLGRIDHQIKIHGFRVETEEIEMQLKQQENIKDALVMLHKDLAGNLWLVAYITLHDTSLKSDINIWKDHLKRKLPEYMVPKDFMIIPAIPLMPNGKVDRKSLPEPEFTNEASVYVAADTELEKNITEIWKNNFGINKIGVNDNFFDLGGNSLIAAKTMIQVEKLTGKRLSLSNLLTYPTIKAIASLLSSSSAKSYKSIIPIKPDGSKPPLYMVHGIGLDVLHFRSIAAYLDKEQPLFGLQSPGLEGETASLDTVEQIAAYYNSEIVRHNPTGPYALAGYSYGGFIAFEMAKQLKQQGKKVKLLAMLDSYRKLPIAQYSLPKKLSQTAFHLFHKFIFRINSFARQPLANITYLKKKYEQKFRFKIKNPGSVNEYDPKSLPGFVRDITKKLHIAVEGYVLKPLDVKIELFKSERRLYYVHNSKSMGWRKFALKGVNVHVVQGDHIEILTPPNDKDLAKAIQRLLN